MTDEAAPIAVVRSVDHTGTVYDSLYVWCPGCEDLHTMPFTDTGGKAPQWTFDGNVESPTLDPSIMVVVNFESGEERRCHSYIRAGVWEYLADSTHQYGGQHVPMVPLPDWVLDW